MSSENVVETDVLVVGGGMAGCFAAIKAREQGLNVTLVEKGYVGKSGATHFAGGYLMVFNPEWGHDLDAWVGQISTRGEYLNNRQWTEIVCKDSYARYQDLVSWGVEFVKEDGKLYRHSRDTTEVIFMWRRRYAPLMRTKALKSGVKIMDRMIVTDLLKHDGKVVGAIGFRIESHDLYIFKAKATVLTTGSANYKRESNPQLFLTGDGTAMAYRAGADLAGREFQISTATLASFPAWRGHGNTTAMFNSYTNAEGGEITPLISYNQDCDFEAHAGRAPIFWNLDAASPEDIKLLLQHQKMTGTGFEAERAGLDITRRGKIQIEVGGLIAIMSTEGICPINTKCATSLPGLYAAGDACSTKASGAVYGSRGMALMGAAVTGARAGLGALEYASNTEKPIIDEEELAGLKKVLYAPVERKGGFSPRWVTQLLKNIMVPYFILHIKHGERLQAALTQVEFLRDHLVPKLTAKDAHELRLAHETKNMVVNAEIDLRSSIFRTESRGFHYREDYPRRDDPAWLAWVRLKQEEGRMKLWKQPIPKKWWPDLSKPYEERYPRRLPLE